MVMNFRKHAGQIIRALSIRAVDRVVAASSDMREMWAATLRHFPSFKNHFSDPVDDAETEARIRFLVAAECSFIAREIVEVLKQRPTCSYADIGDSDGSVRIVMSDKFGNDRLETVGINLQSAVVERMKKMGLNAICEDAIAVGNRGTCYDVVSLFETMEHLPDPIGFLQKIGVVVKDRLVLSVPYIRQSRVALNYLTDRWPKSRAITVETVHIFELSPKDWRRIFMHSGWAIEREWIVRQFPEAGPLSWILSWYWRRVSFEGFYFITLRKDTSQSSRYSIE